MVKRFLFWIRGGTNSHFDDPIIQYSEEWRLRRTRLIYILMSICFIGIALGGLLLFNQLAFERLMETRRSYNITLPKDLEQDLTNTIEFALASGAAKHIGEDDFYHCTVLVPRREFEEQYSTTYVGTLSAYIDGYAADYAGLLCITGIANEETMHSILILKGQQPKEVDVSDLSWWALRLDSRAPQVTAPIDLAVDMTGTLGLYFYLVPTSGEIVLGNGIRLEVEVRYPSVYVDGHPLMIVDL
jgi:hypothetical protein